METLIRQSGYALDLVNNIWINPSYEGIAYSDGRDVENRISNIIKNAEDISTLSIELRQHCVDWPTLYHLSSVRANIMRPFEASLNGDILEIGAGCGAITRFLGECGANVLALEGSPDRASIARARTRDLKNVTILAEKFDDFNFKHKFDVVTLIGVLEYANLFTPGSNASQSMLEQVKSLLKPDGKLIIAIENQLGLKYFAGSPEDHLNQPMLGIEGRYQKDQPETFGRHALAELLKKSGFAESTFLAPFPDYKLPVSILTENGFSDRSFDSAALAWQSVRRDPQLPEHCVFSPELAWPHIIENNLGMDLANSFLVCASPTSENLIDNSALGFHYSADRKPEFCKETIFIKQKNGDININHRRLRRSGDEHPGSPSAIIQFACPDSSLYFSGRLLFLDFVRATTKDGWSFDDVAKVIWQHLAIVEQVSASMGTPIKVSSPYQKIPGELFDLVPNNIITDANGDVHFFDREWRFSNEVEIGYLLFRTMRILINSITRFGHPSIPNGITRRQFIDLALAASGLKLTAEDFARYVSLEASVQAEVTGFEAHNFLNWAEDRPLPTLNLGQITIERAAEIANLKHAVSERDGQINALCDTVNARDARYLVDLREAREATAFAQADAADARNEAAHVRAESEHIKSSTSWRAIRVLTTIGSRVLPTGIRRQFRRGAKAIWWAATPHRLPSRIKFLRGRTEAISQDLGADAIANGNDTSNAIQHPLVDASTSAEARRATPVADNPAPADVIEDRPKAKSPTAAEWDALIASYQRSPAPAVDVLVPVYAGFDETMRCIYSVLISTPATAYNLLVVNDGSPDVSLSNHLKTLADAGLFELHHLEENRGFVGACNFGMSLHTDRDVLLLNSDTEVHSDWLDRIVSTVKRDPRIATATPLTNNAEICSYPRFVQDNWKRLEVDDATLDSLAAEANASRDLDIPTGVGFCMFIRRGCLNEIGLFDFEAFGKGYGEENDLCRRAAAAGWRNVLVPSVFIRHYGGASFGASKLARMAEAIATVQRLHPEYQSLVSQFVTEDPVMPFRRALDLARLKRRTKNGAVLFVLHSWGGGTEDHANDLRAILERAGVAVLICRPDAEQPNLMSIIDPLCVETPNLPVFDVRRDLPQFTQMLGELNVFHIHIHHLAGYAPESADFFRLASEDAGVQYDFTVHDYMSVCPRINMIDGSGVYCGGPEISVCEACISRDGSPFGKPSVWAWRQQYERLFTNARKLLVPDLDVKRRMERYFPDDEFFLRPHPERVITPNVSQTTHRTAPLEASTKSTGVKRVALLGAIGPTKGSALLESVVRAARLLHLPIDFVIVGFSDRDDVLKDLGVEITGRYPREESVSRLVAAKPDFVWLSSVAPETYSYTLSSVFESGIYPVAFDLGAIANRIRIAGWGELLPLDLMLNPASLAKTLTSLVVPEPTDTLQVTRFDAVSEDDLLKSYYGLERPI